MGLLLALLPLALLALGSVVYHIDHLAKVAVETAGTHALGVRTTVGGVHVGLLTGTATMDDLRAANVPGFKDELFLHVAKSRAALTIGSLRQQTVEMPYITLKGIETYIEQSRGGGGNYQVILDNIKRSRGEPPTPTDKPAKGFVIRDLRLQDVKVHVRTLMAGNLLVTFEEIRLTNVGSESDPAQLSELTDTIVRAILTAVANKAIGILPTELLDGLNAGLKHLGPLGEVGITIIGDTAGAVGEIGKALGQTVGDIGKTILDDEKSLGDKATDVAGEAIKGVGEAGKQAVEGAGNVLKGVGGLLKPKEEEQKQEGK